MDIALTIFHWANLKLPVMSEKEKGRLMEFFEPEETTSLYAFGQLSIGSKGPAIPMLSLLSPGELDVAALKKNNGGGNLDTPHLHFRNLRNQSSESGRDSLEWERKECEDYDEGFVGEQSSDSDTSDGSESDPSADEISLEQVIVSGGLSGVFKPDSFISKLFSRRKKRGTRRPASASAVSFRKLTPSSSQSVPSHSRPRPKSGLSRGEPPPPPPSPAPLKLSPRKEVEHNRSNLRHLPQLHSRRVYDPLNFTRNTKSSSLRQPRELAAVHTLFHSEEEEPQGEIWVEERKPRDNGPRVTRNTLLRSKISPKASSTKLRKRGLFV